MKIVARGTCTNCGQPIVRVYQSVDTWDHWVTKGWKPCNRVGVDK